MVTIESWSCHFPQVYIHHDASSVPTDIDGGPSTWFRPMIKGAYLGCGLGISDNHHFTLSAGNTHSVGAFKYYAVVGVSGSVCANRHVYGDDSPISKRYDSICNHPSNTYSKAPGICLVYENRIISWAFSDCVNRHRFRDVLTNIDKSYPNFSSIPDIDHCVGFGGHLIKCFPFPLPPSPPPFCEGQLPSISQTPQVLPICTNGDSNTDICGDPTSTPHSTHNKPCARVTFDNPIQKNGNATSRFVSACRQDMSAPNCITPTTPDLATVDKTVQAAVQNYTEFEAIYEQVVGQDSVGNQVIKKTRWNPHIDRSKISYFGYNLSEYQDLCYDYSNNQSQQVHMNDIYGSPRIFRTCKNPDDPSSSYCIEETSGGASSENCQSEHRYCFGRPNIDKPTVHFCDSNPNTPGEYCMKVISGGQTYTFNKSQKTQGEFRSIETNNNYDTISESSSNICKPYYDDRNSAYIGTGKSGCQYYGGLYYSSNNYKSGANKFCLVGYESSEPREMVCSSAGTSNVSSRSTPPSSTPSPLEDQCCDPSSTDDPPMPYGCTRSPNSPLRSKNPIELGLCVDIMPYTFEDCSKLEAAAGENQEAATQALIGRCRAYQSSCSQINSTNNGYVNADSCNKSFIDCSAGRSPSNGNEETCQFYKLQ